jgi:hypothetical protein
VIYVAGLVNAQQTPAQYAEQTLLRARPPLGTQLPAYTTLLKKFDQLIEAVRAANNPSCE